MKIQGSKEHWDLDGALQGSVAAVSKPRRAGLGEVEVGPVSQTAFTGATLQQHWQFLCAALTKRGQTGAIVPSQRMLVDRMIAPIPASYRGEVVELGAGTGVLTFRLAERCPRARILACEINPELAGSLERNIAAAGLNRRVRVSCDPAEHLLAHLTRSGGTPPEFVLSGIPVGNLVKERANALIGAIHRALTSGGLYVQFQYSLLDRTKIKKRFSRLRTEFVLLNIPPAFVYYASK
jgi:phospholipid N-methyltransferase